jgi:hypothetical protein
MATYISKCSQGQRTDSAWTKIYNYVTNVALSHYLQIHSSAHAQLYSSFGLA